MDDSQRDEKNSKNDQNANMEVESLVKDENTTSESNKVKENDEDVESKDVEEIADDTKSGMYLKYFI